MLLHGTAPSKTRGSFVAAALSTLQLFINEYVANCTQKSDFDLRQFAREKTAIYVLLPDDRGNKVVVNSSFLNKDEFCVRRVCKFH